MNYKDVIINKGMTFSNLFMLNSLGFKPQTIEKCI